MWSESQLHQTPSKRPKQTDASSQPSTIREVRAGMLKEPAKPGLRRAISTEQVHGGKSRGPSLGDHKRYSPLAASHTHHLQEAGSGGKEETPLVLTLRAVSP